MATELKKVLPDAVFVLGGSDAHKELRDINPTFNYIVRGEGEGIILNILDNVENNNELNEFEEDWVKNNCACPVVEETNTSDIYPVDQNVVSKEIPGYFYYDGTSPAQLLIPTPDPVLGLNQKIDWVDHSSNGNVLYNPNTNKVSYDNKSYYNYKNTTDPTIGLKKQLNNFNSSAKDKSLVGDKTYSTNF
jgi:hypothetical protein